MNKVKLNLLAVAAGVLISPALMAADINSTTIKHAWANEMLGLADPADDVTSGDFNVILNAEYTPGDIVTFGFSGIALDPDTVPTSATVVCAAPFAGITFGLLSATAESVQYRVTEIDSACGGTTTVALQVLFFPAGVLEFDPATILSEAGSTVTFNAETATGTPIDVGSGPGIAPGCAPNCNARSTAYVQTGAQFSFTTGMGDPLFTGTVDVESARTVLLGAPDSGGFRVQQNGFTSANVANTVVYDGHEAAFTGDFSWLVDTSPAAGIQFVGATVTANCPIDSVDVNEIVLDCTAAGPVNPVLTFDPSLNFVAPATANAATLPAGPFNASTVVDYSDPVDGLGFDNGNDDDLPLTGIYVGQWVLNGFQAFLSYTPFGTGIGQIIYIANRGPQSGAVTVDYVAQDGTSGTLEVGTLGPRSTLSIGPAIKNALPPALQAFGRLALTITADVPSCDAQVNAQYDASGRRAYTSARDNCTWAGGSF